MGKHFDYTNRKEALDLLAKKWRELGRRPSFDDIKNDPEMPDSNYYATQWGSLSKALDSIPNPTKIGVGNENFKKIDWAAKKKEMGKKETEKEERKVQEVTKKNFGESRAYKVYSEEEAIKIVLSHAKPSFADDTEVDGFLPPLKALQKDAKIDSKGVVEALGGNWASLEKTVIEHEKALGRTYLPEYRRTDYLNSRRKEVLKVAMYEENKMLYVQIDVGGKSFERKFELK